MPRYDLIIKGGTVIDGLQTPRYRADVGIVDGRIAQIGRIDAADGTEVVDATGRIVAPGVVDLHTHYDSQLFWDPWCTMSGWHGVTSVVIGNCGFGFAPCKPEDQDRAMLSLSRNEAVPLATMREGMPWDWETFPEFLDSVDRAPKGVNVMTFVPLAPLYGYVVGIDEAKDRRVTEAELEQMCELLIEGMEAGACGWSVQIAGDVGNVQLDHDGTPMVTDLMPENEVLAFSHALREVGRGTTQITGELETAALIARESGRPNIWNALLADGALNQHGSARTSHGEALQRLKELNEDEGVRVYAQALTTNFASEFTFEEYNLLDAIPCWKEALLGTVEEKRVKLADPERRVAMKQIHDDRGGLFGAGYPQSEIKVHWISSDAPDAQRLKETYEGFTIGEIADREGKHPVDAMLDVAVAGALMVGFATPMLITPPEAMKEIATSTMALPGISDGGAHTKFVTTARYPSELLGYWIREHEIMSLEEAHWRLSAYPAQAAGLRDRGYLREGLPADIIVYDPETVDSGPQERVWDYPAGEWRLIQKAIGYDRIIVNGQTTFIDGECTQATPGLLLRHGTD
ncbi:MAG: amidohydrolase family protein [Acidimicrobiales bacterium]|nr:amidohydrolase family protein [Acidimicrobiales bacterium]